MMKKSILLSIMLLCVGDGAMALSKKVNDVACKIARPGSAAFRNCCAKPVRGTKRFATCAKYGWCAGPALSDKPTAAEAAGRLTQIAASCLPVYEWGVIERERLCVGICAKKSCDRALCQKLCTPLNIQSLAYGSLYLGGLEKIQKKIGKKSHEVEEFFTNWNPHNATEAELQDLGACLQGVFKKVLNDGIDMVHTLQGVMQNKPFKALMKNFKDMRTPLAQLAILRPTIGHAASEMDGILGSRRQIPEVFSGSSDHKGYQATGASAMARVPYLEGFVSAMQEAGAYMSFKEMEELADEFLGHYQPADMDVARERWLSEDQEETAV